MLILKIIILVLVSVILTTTATYIPEDVEILDGYDMDQSPEYYPQDTYSEAESLTNTGLTKAIRNKRSTIDETDRNLGINKFSNLPLDDTQTEPNENADLEEMHPPNKASESIFDRTRRSDVNSASIAGELLPMPAKQIMEPNFYKKGTWNIHSLDTSSDYNTKKYDDDLLVESTNNEGIKGRTPRVNFITQQNKNSNIDKDRGILPKLTSSSMKSRYQQIDSPPNDMYPSRSYEPYLRRYDRYDDQYNRYDPYYEDFYLYRRRYDPYDSYSPRSPTYPDSYYHYPDRRYDVPEPRDYRQLYTNDIYDRFPPPYQSQPPPPLPPPAQSPPPPPTRNINNNNSNGQRRIIYYAHLPEIVRHPTPNIDLTYQRYDPNRYEDQSYIGPVSGAYRNDHQNVHYSTRDQYSGGNNEFVNREKKDHRNIQTYSSSSLSGLPNKNKSDRD